MTAILSSTPCFSGVQGQVTWHGNHISDADACKAYFEGPVSERLRDDAEQVQLENDLLAIATTGMSIDTLKRLLGSEPEREPWQVGESLAECLLGQVHGISWPWNMERDKRTPQASLPGADLVGFTADGDDVVLVLGEVKTSADVATPPCVMTGRSGMIHQLDQLASNTSVHFTLIKWLRARCKNTDFWETFQRATAAYLESEGHQILLLGSLVRDTAPNERDLRDRAKSLAKKVAAPTRVILTAWYVPHPISTWPALAAGSAA